MAVNCDLYNLAWIRNIFWLKNWKLIAKNLISFKAKPLWISGYFIFLSSDQFLSFLDELCLFSLFSLSSKMCLKSWTELSMLLFNQSFIISFCAISSREGASFRNFLPFCPLKHFRSYFCFVVYWRVILRSKLESLDFIFILRFCFHLVFEICFFFVSLLCTE